MPTLLAAVVLTGELNPQWVIIFYTVLAIGLGLIAYFGGDGTM